MRFDTIVCFYHCFFFEVGVKHAFYIGDDSSVQDNFVGHN